MATILITGANGNVSSAAIRGLQGKGHRILGLVRDRAKGAPLEQLGVELVLGDLEKLRTVEAAFDGVDTVFLCSPPGFLAPVMQSNALWAARQGGAKHVVRLSAVGAAHDAPTLNSRLHALSDSEAIGSGLSWTVLKPHFFMQNLLMAAGSIKAQGQIYYALGDAAVPMIDTRDVGAAAAAVLTNAAAHAGKTYTLTGAAITLHEAAHAIGEAIGKKVSYAPVPVAVAIENLAKMGADEYRQVSLRDYLSAYSAGWQSATTNTFKELTGKEPISIAQFARDFAPAFGKE